MATTTTITDYITCSVNTQQRLERIAEIIELLETKAIASVENMDVQEYTLNDGQVTLKTSYRSVKEIGDAIDGFERIYNRLFNRCTGTNIVSLRDAKAFNLNSRNGYGY